VTVTVPFDPTRVTGPLPATLVDWNDLNQVYWPVVVRKVDGTAGTITFSTLADAHVVPVTVASTSPLRSAVHAKAVTPGDILPTLELNPPFFPQTDGFFHPNFDAYFDRGGVCLGMAVYSAWYFQRYRQKNPQNADGLYFMYRNLVTTDDLLCGNGSPADWMDDVTVRELATRSHTAPADDAAWEAMNESYNAVGPDPELQGIYFWTHLASTQSAFVLFLAPQWPLAEGSDGWHAAVVFGYEAPDATHSYGRFDVYDSNYPGQTTVLRFGPPEDDPTGKWTLSYYDYEDPQNPDTLVKSAFTAFGFGDYSLFPPASLEGAKEQADGGFTTMRFASIGIDSATDSDGNYLNVWSQSSPYIPYIDLTAPSTVTVHGRIQLPAAWEGNPNPWLPAFVSWDLNSDLFEHDEVVAADGTFELQIPGVVTPPAELWIVAHDDPHDLTSPASRIYTADGYAGFTKVELDLYTPPSISVTPAGAEIQYGDTLQLTATTNLETSCPMVWWSESPDVAAVDGNGLVTAYRSGRAIIDAYLGYPCESDWYGLEGKAYITVDMALYQGSFSIAASSCGSPPPCTCSDGSGVNANFSGAYTVNLGVQVDAIHVEVDGSESLTADATCVVPSETEKWTASVNLAPSDCEPGPCLAVFETTDTGEWLAMNLEFSGTDTSQGQGGTFSGWVTEYRPACVCWAPDAAPFPLPRKHR